MREEQDQAFLDKVEEAGMSRSVDLLIFNYGREPFKAFVEDIELYNSEEYDDLLYIAQQLGKVQDFVDNFDSIEDKYDHADPYHWKHKKAKMDRFIDRLWR